MVEGGKISNNQAKEILTALFDTPEKSPEEIAKQLGFEQADSNEIDAIIDQVIAKNPGPVAEVQSGNAKAIGFLVGQVMKQAAGKANPKQVSESLRAKLG